MPGLGIVRAAHPPNVFLIFRPESSLKRKIISFKNLRLITASRPFGPHPTLMMSANETNACRCHVVAVNSPTYSARSTSAACAAAKVAKHPASPQPDNSHA
jgi:hypothetical protein